MSVVAELVVADVMEELMVGMVDEVIARLVMVEETVSPRRPARRHGDNKAYLGSGQCERVLLVAAHLNDLKAAKALGLRTVYVARPREEDWAVDDEKYKEARDWVDVWVEEGQGGFVEVARRLGLS